MVFFDYIYFRIFNFYKKEKDASPDIKTTGLVALPQIFILLSILYFAGMKTENYYDLLICIVVVIIHSLYFNSNKRNIIAKKWGNKISGRRHSLFGFLIVLYYILSLLIYMVSLAMSEA